jgi:hypothetical protein
MSVCAQQTLTCCHHSSYRSDTELRRTTELWMPTCIISACSHVGLSPKSVGSLLILGNKCQIRIKLQDSQVVLENWLVSIKATPRDTLSSLRKMKKCKDIIFNHSYILSFPYKISCCHIKKNEFKLYYGKILLLFLKHHHSGLKVWLKWLNACLASLRP